MIHKSFNRAEIAVQYYRLKGQELERENARKRFFLDERYGRLDKNILKEIFKSALQEQRKLLK